jgi:hypothetical protein
MKLESIGEAIAERVLHLSSDGGESDELTVRLGKPQQYPDGNGYFCPYEITAADYRKVSYIAGLDSMQALRLTLRMVSVELHVLRRDRHPGMYFDEPGDDLGFPEQAF